MYYIYIYYIYQKKTYILRLYYSIWTPRSGTLWKMRLAPHGRIGPRESAWYVRGPRLKKNGWTLGAVGRYWLILVDSVLMNVDFIKSYQQTKRHVMYGIMIDQWLIHQLCSMIFWLVLTYVYKLFYTVIGCYQLSIYQQIDWCVLCIMLIIYLQEWLNYFVCKPTKKEDEDQFSTIAISCNVAMGNHSVGFSTALPMGFGEGEGEEKASKA